MKDDLGTRMKEQYENRTRYFLPRRTYTIIRLDGKAFHTFTRDMNRPYDENFINLMDKTAQMLTSEIQGCKMAYTQSDEISLLLTDFETISTDAWFDGNIQKMASVSASIATAHFNMLFALLKIQMEKKDWSDINLAYFDARVFTIPDPTEVENYFIWRQKDAVRNSIAMTAQSLYSHRQLEGVTQVGMQDLIIKKGKNWNDLPDGFKRGRTIYLEKIPYMCEDSFDQTVYYNTSWKSDALDFSKDRVQLSKIIPKIK